MRETDSTDLAGVGYWDQVWHRSGPRVLGRFSYFHHACATLLGRLVSPGGRACEAGCADSVWVPHLLGRGVSVVGIDYSAPGLERLERRLADAGLSADLRCLDLTQGRPLEGEQFDLVFSLGVVEHFRDPVPLLRTLADGLSPTGVLLTVVPNLAGLWGALQSRLDHQVFSVHVVHTPATLDAAHRAAGLEPVEPTQYMGVFGPMLLNAPRIAEAYPRAHRAAQALLWVLQQGVAWPARAVLRGRAESRLLSSHLFGVYRRIP